MKAIPYCIFFVTASIISNACWGQQTVSYESFQGQEIAMSVGMVLKDARFHTYDSTYRASFLSKVETGSPENFMSALYSAQDNEVTRLFSGKSSYSKESRKRRVTADTTRNYYGLKQKITFTHHDRTVAIIGYAEWIDGKPGPTEAITLTKHGSAWSGTDPIDGYDDLYLFVRMVKPEVATKLISGKKTTDSFINDLIAQTRYRRNDLNFSKLTAIIRKWQANGKKENLNRVCDL